MLQTQAAEGVASDQAEPKVAGTEMADTSLADSKQQVNHSCLRKYVLTVLVALGTGTTVALDIYCSGKNDASQRNQCCAFCFSSKRIQLC